MLHHDEQQGREVPYPTHRSAHAAEVLRVWHVFGYWGWVKCGPLALVAWKRLASREKWMDQIWRAELMRGGQAGRYASQGIRGLVERRQVRGGTIGGRPYFEWHQPVGKLEISASDLEIGKILELGRRVVAAARVLSLFPR